MHEKYDSWIGSGPTGWGDSNEGVPKMWHHWPKCEISLECIFSCRSGIAIHQVTIFQSLRLETLEAYVSHPLYLSNTPTQSLIPEETSSAHFALLPNFQTTASWLGSGHRYLSPLQSSLCSPVAGILNKLELRGLKQKATFFLSYDWPFKIVLSTLSSGPMVFCSLSSTEKFSAVSFQNFSVLPKL